jgi:hypothetical protein
MNNLMIVYLIGLILCIVARAIDIELDYMEGRGAVFFTLVFVISPISVPFILFFGLILIIGLVINYISNKLAKLFSNDH